MDKKTIYIILAGLAIIAIWYFMTKKGDIDTGNSGGNTGGSTGGNTGGNTGGSTGGNTGGNTGGSTGGNTGGSTGGSTGGNSGGFKVVETYTTDITKRSSTATDGTTDNVKMRRSNNPVYEKIDGYVVDGAGTKIPVKNEFLMLDDLMTPSRYKLVKEWNRKGTAWNYKVWDTKLNLFYHLDIFDFKKKIENGNAFDGKKRYFSPYRQMYYVAKV